MTKKVLINSLIFALLLAAAVVLFFVLGDDTAPLLTSRPASTLGLG